MRWKAKQGGPPWVWFNTRERTRGLTDQGKPLLLVAMVMSNREQATIVVGKDLTSLLFNECLFHLCDCTCSNVMCILNCLLIKSKFFFEYIICFWKCFYAFVFWVFVQIAFFMFFIKNYFKDIFARSLRVSSSLENELGKKWKHQMSNRNFHDYFMSKGYPWKFLCASKAFFMSNFARS